MISLYIFPSISDFVGFDQHLCQVMSGGYMVAFAGRKYAARSPPLFVADNTHIITSFTLVNQFSCSQHTISVCVNTYTDELVFYE